MANANPTEPTRATKSTSAGKPRPRKSSPRKTKRQTLIKLLSTKSGSDIDRLAEQLGWQRHSVRAGISKLRKEGVEIAKWPGATGRAPRYQIVVPLADAAMGSVKT